MARIDAAARTRVGGNWQQSTPSAPAPGPAKLAPDHAAAQHHLSLSGAASYTGGLTVLYIGGRWAAGFLQTHTCRTCVCVHTVHTRMSTARQEPPQQPRPSPPPRRFRRASGSSTTTWRTRCVSRCQRAHALRGKTFRKTELMNLCVRVHASDAGCWQGT